ncbi:YwqH-like family protein [Terribacillus saccharophilus]|jgi:hypothetical protein|uniref:DUF5082 domain-containing protein n=1 Tax=Terribacillus saccharophilus TaxID=361277 RepID=A0ABX4GZJ2_9BACI|nr:DUF5082 family protein [Terribacillus saccharophilus]PAD36254.1 hypothetical protein CHH56_05505 [Terribacillus saccharophilus]PAD96724.1 hypothetical protein CHH50_06805 [Terribacillus saccharophilus]PAE00300.1 hypothetical protein CHH48_07710 [Terribacillus saccharophilus]
MSLLASLIAGRTDKLEQLSRLRHAKSSIESLQIDMVQHGRTITEPALPSNAWKGRTTDNFDKKRDKAFRTYKELSQNTMDDAIRLINNKIGTLQTSIHTTDFRIEKEKQRIEAEK